jgi:hypothetical protein
MIMNGEVGRARKEVVTGRFNVLHWHLPEGSEEHHDNSQPVYQTSQPEIETYVLLSVKQKR